MLRRIRSFFLEQGDGAGSGRGWRGRVAHLRRQHRPRERAAGGQEHGALDDVAQFADVAGPRIGLQRGQRVGLHAGGLLAVFLLEAHGEGLRQQGHVALAGAQGRDVQVHDGDAVVEVHAEAPRLDLGLQVAVGRGDEAEVDAARHVFAQAIHLALFEHAQQVGLHVQRHFADLVEEQRAALGRFDLAPHASLARARERAVGVAEEFAGQEFARQPAAIEHHEGAAAMQPAGKELLAHAGFPQQQDGDRRAPQAARLFHQFAHGGSRDRGVGRDRAPRVRHLRGRRVTRRARGRRMPGDQRDPSAFRARELSSTPFGPQPDRQRGALHCAECGAQGEFGDAPQPEGRLIPAPASSSARCAWAFAFIGQPRWSSRMTPTSARRRHEPRQGGVQQLIAAFHFGRARGAFQMHRLRSCAMAGADGCAGARQARDVERAHHVAVQRMLNIGGRQVQP